MCRNGALFGCKLKYFYFKICEINRVSTVCNIQHNGRQCTCCECWNNAKKHASAIELTPRRLCASWSWNTVIFFDSRYRCRHLPISSHESTRSIYCADGSFALFNTHSRFVSQSIFNSFAITYGVCQHSVAPFAFVSPSCDPIPQTAQILLFGSKLGFTRILDSLYGAFCRCSRVRLFITPPKVNRFGWNPEHYEYILRGWSWQILGAIRAVATAREPGEWLLCQISNPRCRFPGILKIWP